jgi:hypothetical protein
MQKSLDVVSKWADVNDMKVGHAKCGAMCVRPRTMQSITPDDLVLQGRAIQGVDSYKYLGLEFNKYLDLLLMAEARAAKLEKAINMRSMVWHNASIPVSTKIVMLKAYILPIAMYGAELWGGNQLRVQKVQSLWKKVARTCLGVSRSTSCVAINIHLGLPSLVDLAHGAITRAFYKWKSAKTLIGSLLTCPARSNWSSVVKSSITRWSNTITDFPVTCEASGRVSPRDSRLHLIAEAKKAELVEAAKATKIGKWLKHFQMNKSVKALRSVVPGSVSSIGMRALYQMRQGAFVTTTKLARWGKASDRWTRICPFCGAGCSETVSHLLVSCRAWSNQRRSHLASVLSYLRGRNPELVLMHPRAQDEVVAAALLGGRRQNITLRGWISPLANGLYSSSQGTYGFYEVANFLGEVVQVRREMWKVLTGAAPGGVPGAAQLWNIPPQTQWAVQPRRNLALQGGQV